MNKAELLASLQATYQTGIAIVEKKNADYAGGDDAFRNFRFSTLVGVTPERAILVRITDKLSRISTLLDKEAAVKDEKITDTIIDAINYLAILKAMLEDNGT